MVSQLQGVWVKGVIDELRLDDLGKIVVIEHKTRRNPNLPSNAQKDTARLQVNILRVDFEPCPCYSTWTAPSAQNPLLAARKCRLWSFRDAEAWS